MTDSAPSPAPRPRGPLLRLAATVLLALFLAGLAIHFLLHAPRTVAPLPAEPDAPAEAAPGETPADAEPVPGDAGTAPAVSAEPEDPLLAGEAEFAHFLATRHAADQAYRDGDLDGATRGYLAVLALRPDNADAQRLLGNIYLQRGQFPHAAAMLESSLRHAPYHPDALVALALLNIQIHDLARARTILDLCLRLYPAYPPAIVQDGLLSLAEDRDDLVPRLRAAIRHVPNVPALHNYLSIALARQGDYDAAKAELDLLLAADPGDATSLFNYAVIYAQQGDPASALPWLRKAFALVDQARQREFLADPALAPILGDPAVDAFVRSLDPAPPLPGGPAR